MARPTFVSFDIGSDSRRDLARVELRRHGDWLQRSLWIALPSDARLPEEIGRRLHPHISPSDRLLIHRPCLPCLGRTTWRPAHHGLAAAPATATGAAGGRTPYAEIIPFSRQRP